MSFRWRDALVIAAGAVIGAMVGAAVEAARIWREQEQPA